MREGEGGVAQGMAQGPPREHVDDVEAGRVVAGQEGLRCGTGERERKAGRRNFIIRILELKADICTRALSKWTQKGSCNARMPDCRDNIYTHHLLGADVTGAEVGGSVLHGLAGASGRAALVGQEGEAAEGQHAEGGARDDDVHVRDGLDLDGAGAGDAGSGGNTADLREEFFRCQKKTL